MVPVHETSLEKPYVTQVDIMKPKLSIVLFSVLSFHVFQAHADITGGTILALDREAKMMVLTDRTTWPLELLESAAPDGLKAGDRVGIEYESDEDGVSAIKAIRLLSAEPEQAVPGAADVTSGTVLVHDRMAKILVLTDRTVWPLELLKSAAPDGLKAGDRVEIEYESDEEGVSAINSIQVKTN